MPPDEHLRYRIFPIHRFLQKKSGQNGSSSQWNSDVVQQLQQQQGQELKGSQNVPSTSSSADPKTERQQLQALDGSHNVPSTSSSVDPETGHEFEVFLSFRGSEIRKNFTDCLYQSLAEAGIRTFRDNEELRVGEEIGPKLMKSIKESKIAIPIFSKDYASSKWCLKEVAEMVKCMKESKQLIMPVFLDVTPDDVQHQTGNFVDPFSQHEKKFDTEMVQGWRNALKEVVKLKGLELNVVANGNQGEFIKFIVAKVIKQLKKSNLEMKNNLVGIEDRSEELVRKLAIGINDTRVVGVWGMGGIGKTTLAEFVYNRIVDNFESSSFLSNIRETSKNPNGLPSLQSKLASDILNRKLEEYNNVGEGINELKERLRGKKSLILLDDVDHIEQLKALAADPKWFGQGSRIIITTREKEVLDQHKVRDLYEVALLDEDQALELFCHHAFGDRLPGIDFVKLARDIVNITGRLPLALEVIGSSLSVCGGKKDIWESTVEKLKRKPNIDVQDKLRVSYESLDREEKEIFLDIACFFIGMDVRLVTPMWDDANFFPKVGIEILIMKSLIRIEVGNTIWMHDQLRDLGRSIVEQESDRDPGQRSRVWRSEDAASLLQGQQASSKVEAIRLERFNLTDGMIRNLSRLRILELHGVSLYGNFQHLFHQLRWLGWHGSNLSLMDQVWWSSWQAGGAIPGQDYIMDNITVFDLSQSLVTDNWLGWSTIKIGTKLKVLNLRNCRIRRTPNFFVMPSLEILILESCVELVFVDPSIGFLKNLILLDLRNCLSLCLLPIQMFSLESLVELLISNTMVVALPISEGMKKLEILSANSCGLLREIPSSIGSLENLKRLQLGCSQNLHVLPELPSGLISLTLNASSNLTAPYLANLVNLKELTLVGGSPGISFGFELKEDCLSRLRELEKLHLSTLRIRTLPVEISTFLHLKEIDISCCLALKLIPTLPLSLTIFKMTGCISLRRLPDLSNLKNLLTLEVTNCKQIEEIKGLGNLLSLRILRTDFCFLKKLDGLERLELLGEISFQFSQVERLPDMSKLKNLRMLFTKNCKNLIEIRGLGGLKKLKVLGIWGCQSLEILGELPDCLERLDLSGCMRLGRLPDMSRLQRLWYLDTKGCKNLREIPGLEELSNLRWLDIRGCYALKLPNLSKQMSKGLIVVQPWFPTFASMVSAI